MTTKVHDIYDGTPWTEMDTGDLKVTADHGLSIEHVAEFLFRSADEVRQNAMSSD
jgi:hypothetical protein